MKREQVGRMLGAVSRFAGTFVRGPRRVSLPGIGALACFVGAGLTVNLTAGLAIAGVSLLIVDWRGSGGGQ